MTQIFAENRPGENFIGDSQAEVMPKKRLDRKLVEFQKSDGSGFARSVEALEGQRMRK